MATVYARVSDELRNKLKEEARRNGISLGEQVRLILENYFKEGEGWLRESDIERIKEVVEDAVGRKLRLYTALALTISERVSICSECYALNDSYDWRCRRCGGKTVKGSELLDRL